MTIDKRKFPRVVLTSSRVQLLGISFVWPSGELSHAFDVSHGGAAMSLPAGLNVEIKDRYDLQMKTEGQESTLVTVEVVRKDQQMVAVRFLELSAPARVAFDLFLKQKLPGLNLRLVNPHYYGSKQDFSYWFYGPNESNIFLWLERQKLVKALVEISGKVLVFENDSFLEGQSEGQVGHKSASVRPVSDLQTNALMKSVLELVIQVQEGHELLQPLIDELVKRVQSK